MSQLFHQCVYYQIVSKLTKAFVVFLALRLCGIQQKDTWT
jgi:hypothetical protein